MCSNLTIFGLNDNLSQNMWTLRLDSRLPAQIRQGKPIAQSPGVRRTLRRALKFRAGALDGEVFLWKLGITACVSASWRLEPGAQELDGLGVGR